MSPGRPGVTGAASSGDCRVALLYGACPASVPLLIYKVESHLPREETSRWGMRRV